MPFAATWMHLEIIILSEVSQTQKDKYLMISHRKGKKKDKKERIYKTETDSQTQRTNFWLPAGRGGGVDWEFGIDMYTLLYL